MGNSNGKRNRQYTDEQKRMLVLMCEAAGYPNTEGAIGRVSKEQSIPYKTLEGWVKRGIKYGGDAQAAADELMEGTKAELVDMIEKALRSAITSLPDKIEEATYKDTIVGIGILTDKLQLLKGEPTEHNRLSGDPSAPLEIKAIDYRNAIASLAPRAVSDTDSLGEG